MLTTALALGVHLAMVGLIDPKLGGLELEVVGIMPVGFSGHSAERTDLWMPMATAMRDQPAWNTASTLAFAEIGVRRAPDQSLDGARAQLSAATETGVRLMPIIGADIAPAPHQIAMWLVGVLLFPSLLESTGMMRRIVVCAVAGGACTMLVTCAAGILQLHVQSRSASATDGSRLAPVGPSTRTAHCANDGGGGPAHGGGNAGAAILSRTRQ